MSVCTLAHLWGGSNSYGQIFAPQGSYTKSHLMKWSESISIPTIQRTSVEFWYKGHFYWRIKNEIVINIYKIHLNFVIHRFGGRGAIKKEQIVRLQWWKFVLHLLVAVGICQRKRVSLERLLSHVGVGSLTWSTSSFHNWLVVSYRCLPTTRPVKLKLISCEFLIPYVSF